jgi:FkbH-like protein
MKLREALHLSRQPVTANAADFPVALVCGFQPVHLMTFLAAHLRLRLPERRISIVPGLFGDILGSLERIDPSGFQAVLLHLEWPDLDARLGVRQLGVWNVASEREIADRARNFLEMLSKALSPLAERCRVVCSLPTLPWPPFAHTPLWQASQVELRLREQVTQFALIAAASGVQILSPGEVDRRSAPQSRRDLKAEIFSGFPYQMEHADILAELSALALAPAAPKKGLITDLDETLWSGILGEVGVAGITWDLDHNSQVHGLYQQLLRSFGDAGVLIGVASKNDPEVVRQALARPDLLIDARQIFPVEATWGAKSQSIRRILEVWNIAADAVVFVDDSPMELAEAKRAFPQIHCMQFAAADPSAVHARLYELRNLFGKSHISEEDSLRAESIRHAGERQLPREGSDGLPNDAFLEGAEGVISVARAKVPLDPRALELINKTNQFNLNGRRWEEAEWKRYVARSDTDYFLVSYSDKFGPLGKIAVLCGSKQQGVFIVDIWVMSCRAFSRRIEHSCLKYVFDKLAVEGVGFEFCATERNGPMRDFLKHYCDSPDGRLETLSRETFEKKSPELFAALGEVNHE